jgi:hypothetical protein
MRVYNNISENYQINNLKMNEKVGYDPSNKGGQSARKSQIKRRITAKHEKSTIENF